MKVVHLLGPLRPSGMERMLVSAAPYFDAAGVNSVVVGQGADHPFADDLRLAGYRVRVIPPVKSSAGLRRWMETIREEAPGAVHIHPEQAFAATVLGARLAAPNATIVRTFHSYFLATGWWAAKRRAQAIVSDRFVTTFVALSDEMARHEQRFGRDCVVIPNWVGDRYLEAPQVDEKLVDLVIVGNCADVKNHDVVLRSALNRGWSLAHLGDEHDIGPAESELLAALDSSGQLAWRGVGDPCEWVSGARVYAMPSVREGFPVALAEAISQGARCIVAKAPGFEWALEYPLVTDVAGGDVSDWESALADALYQALPEHSLLVNRQRAKARVSLATPAGVARYVRAYAGDSAGLSLGFGPHSGAENDGGA